MYRKLDRIVFWKLAHWLARKYRTSIKIAMRQWVRRPDDGAGQDMGAVSGEAVTVIYVGLPSATGHQSEMSISVAQS